MAVETWFGSGVMNAQGEDQDWADFESNRNASFEKKLALALLLPRA
jgi:hypothetical protein